MRDPVRVWEEPLVLPTYPAPGPDPHPQFLDRRVYQGSSGRVYPCPVTDHLSDTPQLRAWRAVHIENEYVRVTVLPEIGGRVHVAQDRTNGYDFIYRQTVIKPALVGLLGPWISGGIEFNWPQHHRPTTFQPVDCCVRREPDGSAVVWMGEHEPMNRTKGMVGIRLRPGSAVVEAEARLYNRTPFVQTFLWWANVGVHAHDGYEAFFPPDVTMVADHARRAVSAFPIARGQYYGVDYRRGVDLRWWKNIPVPTSYMAAGSRFDFLGGYDHRREAGIVIVADHHVAAGKKLWTWGCEAFGRAWERELTDADGPYVELMSGVFTDNQPDFSWLLPYESRRFTQHFYPIQKIGPADFANANAAVSLRVVGDRVHAGVSPARAFAAATVRLTVGDRTLASRVVNLAPGAPWVEHVAVPARSDVRRVRLSVVDGGGRELVSWENGPVAPQAPIVVATEPAPPHEISSSDELHRVGTHLEQYRHATRHPEPYWEEALRRDPRDVRCLAALARREIQRGQFARAEGRLRVAVAAATERNANPRDGEVFVDLALALRYQQRWDEAYDAAARAAWSGAWRAPALTLLAEIDCRRRQFAVALEHLDQALDANAQHAKARTLRAAVLARLGRPTEAEVELAAALDHDPLDAWARTDGVAPGAVLDVAYDLAWAGLFAEALARLAASDGPEPLRSYAMAWIAGQAGDADEAEAHRRRARGARPAPVFASRLEDVLSLEAAVASSPRDALAHAMLGHWMYDRGRNGEAVAHWEAATRIAPEWAGPWRNLGIAAFNVERRPVKAARAFGRALAADPHDARLLFEADQLARQRGVAVRRRLPRLEARLDLVARRDDLSVEFAALLTQVGRPDRALAFLEGRRFHPWEGGEGLALGQYVRARLRLGRLALHQRDVSAAVRHFEAALDPPASLGEARHPLQDASDVYRALGDAAAAGGSVASARRWWTRAASGAASPRSRRQPPPSEHTYEQALALRSLGRIDEAKERLVALAAHARRLAATPARIDYFATSLPELRLFAVDLDARQREHASFLLAQSATGLGQRAGALQRLRVLLARDPAHAGAADLLAELTAARESGRRPRGRR